LAFASISLAFDEEVEVRSLIKDLISSGDRTGSSMFDYNTANLFNSGRD
jgi:hypothetical protein